jgi:hypothetical protein
MTTKTAKPTPVLRIPAGRAAAALAAAKAAEGHEPAAKALAASMTPSGQAALAIDKPTAAAIVSAVMAGIDAAALKGQQRGAVRKAVVALIEAHRLSRSDVSVAVLKPAPKASTIRAAKTSANKANAPATATTQ